MKSGVTVQPVQLIIVQDGDGTGLAPIKADSAPDFPGPSGAMRTAQWGIDQNLALVRASVLSLDDVSMVSPADIVAPAHVALPYGDIGGILTALSSLNLDNIDGQAGALLNAQLVAALGVGFDGANIARLRTASVVNSLTLAQMGVSLVTPPAHWSQAVEAAVTVQATTSRAATVARRHICNAIGGTLVGVAAIAAPLYLRLRDGATGAGTILWSQGFTVALGASVNFSLSGLNIVGSTNTAMTLEWSAGPGATNFEAVSLSGYTV